MVAAENSSHPPNFLRFARFTIPFSASFLLAVCAAQPRQPTPTLTNVVAVAGVGSRPPAAIL